MSSKSYEYLEHTADLFFRSYGKTLGECYANAARAMSSAIISPDSVDAAVKRDLSLESDSLPVLMHDWLSELLFLFGTEGLVFREYSVSVEKKDSSYVLNASMSGEQFSRKKHVILTDIKAVTYHSLKVEERAEGWIAEVLCDI